MFIYYDDIAQGSASPGTPESSQREDEGVPSAADPAPTSDTSYTVQLMDEQAQMLSDIRLYSLVLCCFLACYLLAKLILTLIRG